ncbi:Uncharacterized protein Rs2_28238 [Raphanus sativus]|nr:Uncharacterized protein Rs2_28238 [Raphanus sativus]
MDPKQPVVLQLLESLKESYMSNDFKTCQQLLGQIKEIVDQKASLHETNNREPNKDDWPRNERTTLNSLPLDMKYVVPNPWEEEYELLDDFIKFPLDMKYVDSNHWEEEFEENTKDEDLSKIPFDP